MKLLKLGVDKIKPNPYQPREKFDEEKLQELADNIKAHGMIEPIVVTKRKPEDKKYTIVAGERRWRASKKADIKEMYVLDKEYASEADIKRDSLVENELRENLSNKEFKEFAESLAKSLGTQYYTKDGVNSYQLTSYVFGTADSAVGKAEATTSGKAQTFRSKLMLLIKVEKHGVKELKDAVDSGVIGIKTASQIASVANPATQRTLTALAAAKDHEALSRELKKYNLEKQYENLIEQDKEKETNKPILSEDQIVIKTISRLNEWCAHFDIIIGLIKYDEMFMGKFSQENRLKIMDTLKPLIKKAKTFNELAENTMIKIGE